MKVTLQVNGQEMTFSEQELSSILKGYVYSWFEVKPQAIDQKLFEKKRNDDIQEATRQLILEAFAKMKDNPEKYGKNFKTMLPQSTWSSGTIKELEKMASNLGDHLANWIEQALEWAQRIANGESWEAICKDGSRYRLVNWKIRYATLMNAGDIRSIEECCELCTYHRFWDDEYDLEGIPPLVVFYE